MNPLTGNYNFTGSLQAIHPTLQAAAQRMCGEEFCDFTHQVRVHYEAHSVSKLADLFRSRDIRPSMESARQLIFARMHAFDEPPPLRARRATLPSETRTLIRLVVQDVLKDQDYQDFVKFAARERADQI